MDQVSEHMNSSNPKIHSYDQMIKMVVNVGSKETKNKDNSSPQLTDIENSLRMSIFDTPEKDLSNVNGKYDMIKLRTSSVKSS